MTPPTFQRYIGIDYSGAKTADSPLTGLRVYDATRATDPIEVRVTGDARAHWTRRGLAMWLLDALSADVPTIVGIDHGFSLPMRYIEAHGLDASWPSVLDDFHRHWPTDAHNTSVDDVREGRSGSATARSGNARWRRITEERVGAKSVFHFDVPGSVAKSTHAGLPWLWYLRRQLGARLHWWPFDGWSAATGTSVIAEVYPRLWSATYPQETRTADQHDAYAVTVALRDMDMRGALGAAFYPTLAPGEQSVALTEGWILGVT